LPSPWKFNLLKLSYDEERENSRMVNKILCKVCEGPIQ
jgi:hypothetical protein